MDLFLSSTWDLLPPFIILFVLVKFAKNDVTKYICFLSLKLFFLSLLSLIEEFLLIDKLVDQLGNRYPAEIVGSVLSIVPEFVLTLVIVYSFRHLYKVDKLTWLLFLIGDTIHWLSLFVLGMLPVIYPEPNWLDYSWVFWGLLYPYLYAFGGFIFIKVQANTKSNAY